nr:GyrI-like domain-containing protein [Nocardia sp. BMG111209]
MTKTDFKKTLDSYRAKGGEFRILEVPPMRYLMIDGHGDPNSAPEFTAAVEALYPVAYKLKFASKQDLDRDYVVMPLEGLWWSADMATFTTARDKSHWDWTMMSMVPEWITREMFRAAVAKVAAKNPPSGLDRVRLETLAESHCVQTLHIGSFDDEAETLRRMHDEFIPGAGLRMVGKHHEIYLSDLRRTEPGALRTILRQPVVATARPVPALGLPG